MIIKAIITIIIWTQDKDRFISIFWIWKLCCQCLYCQILKMSPYQSRVKTYHSFTSRIVAKNLNGPWESTKSSTYSTYIITHTYNFALHVPVCKPKIAHTIHTASKKNFNGNGYMFSTLINLHFIMLVVLNILSFSWSSFSIQF